MRRRTHDRRAERFGKALRGLLGSSLLGGLLLLGGCGGSGVGTEPVPWKVVDHFAAGADVVAVDGNDNVYIAGPAEPPLGLSFVRRYSSSGSLEWTQGFDKDGARTVDGNGNLHLAGYTQRREADGGGWDGYVRKYGPNGAVQWMQEFVTASFDSARAIWVNVGGNVYVVGHAGEGEGTGGTYVRKYDANGVQQWARQFGTSEYELVNAVTADDSGNVYVVGDTRGDLQGTNAGGVDSYLRKYDANGTHEWTHQFGSSSPDFARAVAVDGSGGVYVAGFTYGELQGKSAGNNDSYLRKYDTNGTHEWTRQFGTSKHDGATTVSVDGRGGVYLAGFSRGSELEGTAGGPGCYVRKYSTNGAHQWTLQFGSSTDDVEALAVDGNGHVYAAGYTQGGLEGASPRARSGYLVQIQQP